MSFRRTKESYLHDSKLRTPEVGWVFAQERNPSILVYKYVCFSSLYLHLACTTLHACTNCTSCSKYYYFAISRDKTCPWCFFAPRICTIWSVKGQGYIMEFDLIHGFNWIIEQAMILVLLCQRIPHFLRGKQAGEDIFLRYIQNSEI